MQSSNRTFMELKYTFVMGKDEKPVRSNRTFMELKLTRLTEVMKDKAVLIVPLWN